MPSAATIHHTRPAEGCARRTGLPVRGRGNTSVPGPRQPADAAARRGPGYTAAGATCHAAVIRRIPFRHGRAPEASILEAAEHTGSGSRLEQSTKLEMPVHSCAEKHNHYDADGNFVITGSTAVC